MDFRHGRQQGFIFFIFFSIVKVEEGNNWIMGFKQVQEDVNTLRTRNHMKAKPDGNKPIDILATTPGGKKLNSKSQIDRS